jgi:hypothetical protein
MILEAAGSQCDIQLGSTRDGLLGSVEQLTIHADDPVLFQSSELVDFDLECIVGISCQRQEMGMKELVPISCFSALSSCTSLLSWRSSRVSTRRTSDPRS